MEKDQGHNSCGIALDVTDTDITFNDLGVPRWVQHLLRQEYGDEDALSIYTEHEAAHYGEPTCLLCQIGY